MAHWPAMTVRPYEVMCAVCALGEQDPARVDPRSAQILDAVRQDPDRPLCLRCNAGGVWAWQAPGTEADTPEGADLNVSRDLEILHKLNLFPGAALTARIAFGRLLQAVGSKDGLCGDGQAASDVWAGCPKAGRGN